MKKKTLLVLLATMTLTLASVGTVFAYGNNGDVVGQSETEEHVHTWGDPIKVVDKAEIWSESEWVEPVYGEDKWVVDKEAVYEPIVELHQRCNGCGLDLTATYGGAENQDKYWDHNFECGNPGFRDDWVTVGQKLIQEEQGHWEKGDLISEGYWTDPVLISPEEFHYEHTCTVCGEIQNSETGEVIEEGKLPTDPDVDPSEPTDPKDPSEPTNPTDPVKPSDPTETEKPETDNKENTTTQEQENTDKKTDTETTTDKKADTETTAENTEGKAPKTGDVSSMIYLATLAGSAVTGGTAFGLRRKFRK